jgi:hypothetical protein
MVLRAQGASLVRLPCRVRATSPGLHEWPPAGFLRRQQRASLSELQYSRQQSNGRVAGGLSRRGTRSTEADLVIVPLRLTRRTPADLSAWSMTLQPAQGGIGEAQCPPREVIPHASSRRPILLPAYTPYPLAERGRRGAPLTDLPLLMRVQ